MIPFVYSKEEQRILDNSPQYVLRENDDDCLHGYTYTRSTNQWGNPSFIFDTHELTPNLKKSFYAPSGYVISLEISEDQIDEIYDQMVFFGLSSEVDTSLSIKFSYITFDSEVDVITDNSFYDGSDGGAELFFKNTLRTCTNGKELFKIKDATFETTLSFVYTLSFHSEAEESFIELVFKGDPYELLPPDETEYVMYNIMYEESHQDVTRNSITLMVFLIDDFFKEKPNYNPYGFMTDETLPDWEYNPETGENHYRAVYTLSLIANDSIPVGFFDGANMLTITYPANPLSVKIKLEFTSGGKEYAYYSKKFIIGDPNLSVVIDDNFERDSVQRNTEHEYSIHLDNCDYKDVILFDASVNVLPSRLTDEEYGFDLFDKEFPKTGVEGKYYYLPSDEEIALHNEGRDSEFINEPAGGEYFVWDKEEKKYVPYEGVSLIKSHYDYTQEEEFDFDSLAVASMRMPFSGNWTFNIDLMTASSNYSCNITSKKQTFTVAASEAQEDYIILNMPDEIHLLHGGKDIEIIPTISTYKEDINYYYDYEVSRDGVVNVIEGEDGKLTIRPLNTGLITLTINVESIDFSKISKTISIRVLDAIYDISSILIPDEFHFAGQDLTAAICIRGFTEIHNIDVDWTITDKNGVEVDSEKIVVHNNATMTFVSPERGDYTIEASYEGIKLDSVVVQIRKIDINAFLRQHIWWIVLITIGLVVLVAFIMSLTKRGRTMLDHIERVNELFHQCLSDDRLTKSELLTIRKETSRCLHRCEDLNIEAFNQYEKAVRYLKKSLNDVNALLKKWDNLTPEDKSVLINQLDKDLAKALSFAEEIETAKKLVEDYHTQANRNNFESVQDDNPKKKSKK